MKIADIEIKEQEFGETTKEPGLVSKQRSLRKSNFCLKDFCFR